MKRESLYLSTVDPRAGDLARKWGLGVELAEFCTAWNLDDEFPETDIKVRKELKGVERATLHGPYNELFPCAIDRKARALAADRFLQTVQVARGYGISKIVLHGGYNPHLYYPVWFVPQSVLFFKDLVAHVPEGITLCLENVLETEPGMIGDIVREVDDPRLRMCLDVGHAEAYSHCHPDRWITECRDIIAHFHVHNNNGTQDLHAPLFDGVIPMEQLLAQIQDSCPQASITLELPDGEASLEWLQERRILEEKK